MDTLRGLQKARQNNFFNFDHFPIEEFEYYEKVENGRYSMIICSVYMYCVYLYNMCMFCKCVFIFMPVCM